MDYFPLFARLTGEPCLVVGGGEVAWRKCRALLRAGAAVTVVAPALHPELEALARDGRLTHLAQVFSADCLGNAIFVVAATDDTATNEAVSAAARTAQCLCNVVDNPGLSTAIVPAVVDRSPVVIAVSTGGSSPVLATRLRQQLDSLLPQNLGKAARFCAEWRQTVKQRLPEARLRLRYWQDFFSGPLYQQLLSGQEDAVRNSLEQQLEETRPATPGMVWLVGAGSGDAELLTLKAARVLLDADVIIHDRLVAPAVLDMARRDAEFISVGKQADRPSIGQPEINALLVEQALAGRRVCRLKGGDPFIFGRGGEEIEALEQAGVPWEVVPGITAAAACAASTGVPLTHRDVARSLTLVTGRTQDDAEPDWPALSRPQQTVVFYMAVSKLQDTCRQLIAAGRSQDCPAMLVENGSTASERSIRGTLQTLPDKASDARSPALLIVGEVVNTIGDRKTQPAARTAHQWSAAAENFGHTQDVKTNR